jgi:hypothetical protein
MRRVAVAPHVLEFASDDAAAVQAVAIGGRLTLLVGDSGTDRSTLAAHLLVCGRSVP